jgi:competence protein ComGC
MKNKAGGFLTLISLLIAVAIISIWFYSSSTNNIKKQEDVNLIQTGIPTITETRNDIQKAEDVKKLVESKYENLDDF